MQNSKQKGQSVKIDLRKFSIIKCISSGGFSNVYSIKENKTNQLYAAKVIKYSGEEDDYKKMINREITIMVYIKHPTIIKFYGYSLTDFRGDKNVTIIMELFKNGSLSDCLSKIKKGQNVSNYNNTARQIILIGIARAMKFLHQHCILHRDLKPGNVILDERLYPRIIDFGLSKFFEPGKVASITKQCGTPIYMAPEVIEDNVYNEKTDVYAFGILMYEVVTDQIPYPPYQRGDMADYKFKKNVIEKDYRPVFSIDVKKSIQELIELCWSKEPKKRPTFSELFDKLTSNNKKSIHDFYSENEEEEEEEENDIKNDHEENFKYFLDDVDIQKVQEYLSTIEETAEDLKDQVNFLSRENHEMKEKLTTNKNEIKRLKSEISKYKSELKFVPLIGSNESVLKFKVIFLGSTNVGKTTIINRIVSSTFSDHFKSTIQPSFKSIQLHVNGQLFELQLWDTAGQEQYRSLGTMYYRGAHAAIVVYDVTKQKTFDDIKSWIDDFRSINDSTYFICVVGNKNDLESEVKQDDAIKSLSVNKINYDCFILTSARTGSGIDDLINETASRINKLYTQSNCMMPQSDVALRDSNDGCC